MSKQTAVEWYIDQEDELEKIKHKLSYDNYQTRLLKLKSQAKQMEREQIVKAHEYGTIDALTTKHIQECDINPMAEQYYHETYGGKQ